MSRRRLLVATAVAAAAAVIVAIAAWAGGGSSTPVRAAGPPSSSEHVRPSTAAARMAAGTTTGAAETSATAAPGATVAPSTTVNPPIPRWRAPVFESSIGPVSAADVSASYRSGCPVPPDQLRMVTVSHWGFDGFVHTGRIVVRDVYASAIVSVFNRLYDVRFPIERMEPVDVYGGSDDASMAANNTSAFNCRPVTGGTSFSEHAYGRAIDVNPVQNPYVSGSTVLPPAGRAYANPNTQATGKIHAGDAVVQAFQSIGWFWGGAWSSPKDYQHFSSTNH